MPDHADDAVDRWDRADERPEPDGVGTVESYEVDEGVVFYDAENPLAWVESRTAVVLHEHA
jgi:hypothetical protein